MKIRTIWLLIMYVMMAGCATRQSKLDNETAYNLLTNFAATLQYQVARTHGEYKYKILNVAEHDNWNTYEYQIRDYLMRRSPRSSQYLKNWYLLEFSFREGPLEVRRLDPGAVNKYIMIDSKKEWKRTSQDLDSFPLNAVFGPIYMINQWSEIITTVRFIVQKDCVMESEWIAVHKKDGKGEWFIIEIACVSSYKNWTVYVNEEYVD